MIPNLLRIVEHTKREHPQAWAHAHTGDRQTEDFIRLCAANCHAVDSRFGLNGKRGDPNDISDDALNYLGEGPGHDPTHGNAPVTVIDVIGAAGSPAAVPQWAVIDLPGAGAWVRPTAVPVPPEPPQQPYPSESPNGGWWGQVFDVEVAKRYKAVGRVYPDPADPRSLRWCGRVAYDIRDGLTKEASLDKHMKELDQQLGIP